MIAEILALVKVAHEGGGQTLLIVVLCVAWLRERQQVHILGQRIFELAHITLGEGAARDVTAVKCCLSPKRSILRPAGTRPGDLRGALDYVLRKLRERR